MCTNPRKIIQNGEELTVKCGKCPTCQRERTQEWAIKLINESKYHSKACFITLTFDNKILLDKNSIAVKKYGAHPGFVFNIENSKEYFKKFIKRLRKHYEGTKITYYHVGEYGEKTHRPHHHLLLFGIDFKEDRKPMPPSKSGKVQEDSEILRTLWALGRVSVQDVNPNNVIYISQYSLKKFKNNELNKRYKGIQSFSNRSKMSCKWVRRNPEEIIKGYIEDNDGKKYRIPRSYINTLKKEKGNRYEKIYMQYENNIMERTLNISNNELIKRQKIKEEQLEIRNRNFNKKRDID